MAMTIASTPGSDSASSSVGNAVTLSSVACCRSGGLGSRVDAHQSAGSEFRYGVYVYAAYYAGGAYDGESYCVHFLTHMLHRAFANWSDDATYIIVYIYTGRRWALTGRVTGLGWDGFHPALPRVFPVLKLRNGSLAVCRPAL